MRVTLMFGAALLVCLCGGLQAAEECSVVRTGSSLFHVFDHDGMPTGTTYALKDGRFDLDTARDKTLYFLVTFP
jgi:hypothetical protein